jgi:transposase-like protein
MARTKRTARKSTGGWAPRHHLTPREPCPEPTEAERLRDELAEVTAARDAAQQHLEQVIHDRDQETLAV